MTAQAIANRIREGRIVGGVFLRLEVEGVGLVSEDVDQDVVILDLGGGGLRAVRREIGADRRVGAGLSGLAGGEELGPVDRAGEAGADGQQDPEEGEEEPGARAHRGWIPAE